MNDISIKDFKDSDIDLYTEWLYKDYVFKWFADAEDCIYEIKNRNKEYSWVKHYIVEVGSK